MPPPSPIHPRQAANEALARSQAEKAALTEECAALKGRLTALEEQLAGLAAVGSSAEALRASALEDASRLRGEVAGVAAQRDNAVAEAARLRGELEAARWIGWMADGGFAGAAMSFVLQPPCWVVSALRGRSCLTLPWCCICPACVLQE